MDRLSWFASEFAPFSRTLHSIGRRNAIRVARKPGRHRALRKAYAIRLVSVEELGRAPPLKIPRKPTFP